MKLKVLGSSSAGNCYILENDGEALIIEAGIKFSEVKKAVNFDISRIVGCLISHEHGDHAKYVQNMLDARIPVFASKGTIKSLNIKDNANLLVIANHGFVEIKGFEVMPFNVRHDAAEPFGFLIHHPETGTALFATDTCYLSHTFKGLNNILIECNYRLDILDENTRLGIVQQAQRDRTLQNHMSYDTCMEALLANDLKAVNNIVLIHLSSDNSNAAEFRQGIREATGKTVHVADKGMILNFNKTPF
jgi:phosphoribosyl 1,2-cyclic phosphodiesterase